MAVRRGGVAFWKGLVIPQSRRQPIYWTLKQVVDCRWSRPLSCAAWTLTPPNSLRYQITQQPLLSHPLHHASSQQSRPCYEEDWQKALSVPVLLGESDDVHAVLELPVLMKAGRLQILGPRLDLSFCLTAVDGSREDDITVEDLQGQQESLRDLLDVEQCPAPFLYTSQLYYCHIAPVMVLEPRTNRTPELVLCSYSGQVEEEPQGGQSEGEENLALMYERLRVELPSFFMTKHDYTMYSNDVEFINGLLNIKTRFLVLCYYSEARLDVLKLTKHPEDSSIKARWRIRGLPFHSALLRFYRRDRSHLFRSYDAFSTFYVGPDGLIHRHKVEKVIPAQPPVHPVLPTLLTGVLVALGIQENRPALNLLPLLLSSWRQSRA